MTDPTKSDDNWAELYRELGVEDTDPSPRAPQPEPREQPPVFEEEVVELTTAHAADAGAEEDVSPAIESEELGVIEGEFEPAEAEAEGEGEAETEGEPGKKRRRRRRRRKKKGGPNGQPEAAEGEAEGEAEEAEGAEGEPEEGEEAEEPAAVGAEEEVSPEVTRELIANWNVPSWQEIVAGLYRPDR
jgi:ribonuclease E